jgi:hypothetical protein
LGYFYAYGFFKQNNNHDSIKPQNNVMCRFTAITPTRAARGARIAGKLTRARREALGKAFRAGLGRPPPGETGRFHGIWFAHRLERATNLSSMAQDVVSMMGSFVEYSPSGI